MGMFKTRAPRGFHHNYIYVDERREKLAKIEEKARRELGLLPPEPFNPERIRGKFVEGTTHLKAKKDNGGAKFPTKIVLVALAALIFIWIWFF